MRNFLQISTLIGVTAFAISCERPGTSKQTGHIEDGANDANPAHLAEVVPEYEASDSLIVSQQLLMKADKSEFLSDVLKGFSLHVYASDLSDASFTKITANLRSTMEKDMTPEEVDATLKKVKLFRSEKETAAEVTSWATEIWARDWAPITGKDSQGELHYFDFNYYSKRKYEDAAPSAFYHSLKEQQAGSVYQSLPVYNEGGNFMVGGNGHCMLSDLPLEKNRKQVVATDVVLDNGQIKDMLKRRLGCKRASIFPSMPYEKTKHIDLWAKFVSNDTVFVGVLNWDQENEVQSEHRSRFAEMKRFLDDRAREIRQMGYKVVDVPMPTPLFISKKRAIVRSYLNSLLMVRVVSGSAEEKVAYVPRYETPKVPNFPLISKYPGSSATRQLELRTRKLYEGAGYRVMYVPADDLISQGGAIHCVTMQVPKK